MGTNESDSATSYKPVKDSHNGRGHPTESFTQCGRVQFICSEESAAVPMMVVSSS